MRKYAILCFVAFISINVFSQRVIDEKREVQFVKYPQIPMKGVETYSIKFHPVDENLEGKTLQYAPDKHQTSGALALQGYRYNEETPDVTISLITNPVNFPDSTIENISESHQKQDFRAIFKTVPSWEIKIRGEFSRNIKLADFKDSVSVMFPPRYDAYGIPTKAVPNPEIIEKTFEKKEEEVRDYVKEALYEELLFTVREVVKNQLSYSKKVQKVEVEGFKSNNRHDYSAWNTPYTSGIEILNKLNSGADPSDLYNEYKNIFDFWDSQIEEGLSDPKKNKKELRVASNNLVNLLYLVNPAEIKDKYLERCNNFFPGSNEEKTVEDAKARWKAFKDSDRPYSEVFAISPLGENCYNLEFSDKKGKTKQGIISLSGIFGKNPAEACNALTIYKKSTYDEEMGQPRSRDKMKEKNISAYSLLGFQYEKVEYKDPTAVTFGKEDAFMEEMIKGEASLYRMYEPDGGGGLVIGDENKSASGVEKFVISKDGDAELVFNYNKLAKILKDNPDVAKKIENGEYGNKPKKDASGLGKLMQEGEHQSISEEALVRIVKDYNK